MENTISINEVLKIMDMQDERGNSIPFDIQIREFSRQNKTGGKLKFYNDARKPKAKKGEVKQGQSGISKLFAPDVARKNPNHFENRTRNIELSNGLIKKINYLFIIKFNEKIVVY